jgi:arsenical-resistance protein 2
MRFVALPRIQIVLIHSPYQTQGGTVQGSINLPAQSLYPTMPSLHALFKAAGVRQVIFYCSEFNRMMQSATRYF